MRELKQLIMGIAIISLPVLLPAFAPLPPEPQVKASVLATEGDIVLLFHWGYKGAKEEFGLNEVVPVFRYFGRGYKHPAEVGKVRITRYLGEHYLEGVVVEGKIKDNDVAMKPNNAGLIRLRAPEEK